jgi:tellurite methyltransferase
MPKAMLADHSTGANVWGVIHVASGELRYSIGEQEVHTLTPGVTGIIEPQVTHSVVPVGEVSFYVEFFKVGT